MPNNNDTNENSKYRRIHVKGHIKHTSRGKMYWVPPYFRYIRKPEEEESLPRLNIRRVFQNQHEIED